MTTVTASLVGMNDAPARGYLRFSPSMAEGVPLEAGLPLPIIVKLVDGAMIVELDPTGPTWAWEVQFQIYGLAQWTRYYAVPSSGTYAIGELVEVDPATLDPAITPTPNWFAFVDQVIAGQVGKVIVVTGAEPRPAFGSVFWVGGTIQPTNMAESTDIWFKEQ